MADTLDGLCQKPGALKKAIVSALRPEYLYFEPFAEALTSAILTPCHLLLSGPGGYGKSEMTKAAFTALQQRLFVKGLTPETTFAELIGGLDARELLSTGAYVYRANASFLAHPFVVLEEILDASGQALSGLKDILADGWLRNGEQQVQLKTRTLIGATNRSPEEFAQGDDSLKALLSRFTLHHRIFWPSHEMNDFRQFFRLKIALPRYSVQLKEESDASISSLIETLSHVLAELSEPGREVSPRVALQCFEQLLIARKLHGHRLVWDADLETLKRVQDLQLGLSTEEPIDTAIKSAIGRYGFLLCCNQVGDRIERLARRYDKANDSHDEIATCMAEHRSIELYIESMLDIYRGSRREIVALKTRLADVGKSKGNQS